MEQTNLQKALNGQQIITALKDKVIKVTKDNKSKSYLVNLIVSDGKVYAASDQDIDIPVVGKTILRNGNILEQGKAKKGDTILVKEFIAGVPICEIIKA